MGKHFFDYDDGDFAHTISDNMAIDSDGDLLMRMGDNMAMDMDSGELHIISGWSDDEDDDSLISSRLCENAEAVTFISSVSSSFENRSAFGYATGFCG